MNIRDDLEIFGVVYNKQFEICKYIAENTNPSTNTFIGTYSKISKDVNVSQPTISTIMKKLQANNFIKKVQNGVWLVDSDFIEKIKKGIWLINLNSGKGEKEIKIEDKEKMNNEDRSGKFSTL